MLSIHVVLYAFIIIIIIYLSFIFKQCFNLKFFVFRVLQEANERYLKEKRERDAIKQAQKQRQQTTATATSSPPSNNVVKHTTTTSTPVVKETAALQQQVAHEQVR